MPMSLYDRRTIFLHWVTAALVIITWASGQTIDWFPKGPIKIDARSVHFVLGTSILVITAYRIYWRSLKGEKFHDGGPVLSLLARLVKLSLYVAILTTVSLGIYNLLLRGDSIFNLVSAPKIGDLTALARHQASNTVTDIHVLCANIILGLAGLHAAAALLHRFVLKDRVFQRMWPSAN